jgi:dTDP-4-dehydrorhamnose reductase
MIYLFGSTGMLGNYVKIILSKNYDIKCITRKKYDILNESFEKLNKLLCNLNDNDIVINCAGIIPQKTKNNDYSKFIKINTLFPHKLQNIVEKFNAKLIHISTDCVFNGEKGDSYDENDAHTETKIYGISKSLGEPENTTIIRTSIIGEEIKEKKGLIEWVINNKNKTINGYNNLWNGVTCLTLAKIIKTIIQKNIFWKGVKHIYSPDNLTKYDLCVYINEIYKLNIKINKDYTEKVINKTLKSNYKPIIEIPKIKTQIYLQYLFNKKIHILGKNSFIGKNLFDLMDFNTIIYSHKELHILKKNINNNDIIINCCGFNDNIYEKLYDANVSFVNKLINIINNFKNIKLIHFSTLQLSYKNKNSKNNYIKTKQQGEKIIIEQISSFNCFNILRLCNIYGYNHLKPYKNSFINTLIYEKKKNIKKKYKIKKNDIYLLNINKLPEIVYNIIPKNNNTINNIISQKMNICDIISNLFEINHIQKYFTFVEGSPKNIIDYNNIIIND